MTISWLYHIHFFKIFPQDLAKRFFWNRQERTRETFQKLKEESSAKERMVASTKSGENDLGTLWWTYKKQLKMAIYSEFSHNKWWFSIAMLVHQRVNYNDLTATSLESWFMLGKSSRNGPRIQVSEIL